MRKHKLCIQYLIADMVITKPFLTNETNKMYQVIGFCARGPSLQIQLTPILHKRQQADGCGFIFNQQIWGVILIFQFDAQREIKKKEKKRLTPKCPFCSLKPSVPLGISIKGTTRSSSHPFLIDRVGIMFLDSL